MRFLKSFNGLRLFVKIKMQKKLIFRSPQNFEEKL